MKKNLTKIVIMSAILIIGIGAVVITSNMKEDVSTPVVVVDETEDIAPETEEIETEEYEEIETIAKNDNLVIKKDYWENASYAPQNTRFTKEETVEEAPVVEETVVEETVEEIPVVESPAEVVEKEVLGIENQPNEVNGHYDSASDITDFKAVPVSCTDFSTNANLIALQAEVNPVIYAECGGGNENTGFVLRNSTAYISYAGKEYGTEAGITVSSEGAKLEISCNLNDLAWKCMSATMEEIYPSKGAALISEVKKDCISGSSVYGDFDTWTEFNGIHTKVFYDSNDGTLLYVFK